jgi:hypothetical protein
MLACVDGGECVGGDAGVQTVKGKGGDGDGDGDGADARNPLVAEQFNFRDTHLLGRWVSVPSRSRVFGEGCRRAAEEGGRVELW